MTHKVLFKASLMIGVLVQMVTARPVIASDCNSPILSLLDARDAVNEYLENFAGPEADIRKILSWSAESPESQVFFRFTYHFCVDLPARECFRSIHLPSLAFLGLVREELNSAVLKYLDSQIEDVQNGKCLSNEDLRSMRHDLVDELYRITGQAEGSQNLGAFNWLRYVIDDELPDQKEELRKLRDEVHAGVTYLRLGEICQELDERGLPVEICSDPKVREFLDSQVNTIQTLMTRYGAWANIWEEPGQYTVHQVWENITRACEPPEGADDELNPFLDRCAP